MLINQLLIRKIIVISLVIIISKMYSRKETSRITTISTPEPNVLGARFHG